jgi:hypothetical protein
VLDRTWGLFERSDVNARAGLALPVTGNPRQGPLTDSLQFAEQSVLTVDEVADVVGDTANWWTDEGPRAIVEVVTTEEGDAIVSAVPGDRLYGFRNRD